MIVAILAPGESMSAELARAVARRYGTVIAVTEAFRLLPSVKAIVAQDLAWWDSRPEASALPCDRWSTNYRAGLSRVAQTELIGSSTNSGLVALHVAIEEYKANEVRLFGFDLRGSHYFGAYADLKNTSEVRFAHFRGQFARYAEKLRDVAVLNCTVGSALDCFRLEEEALA